MPIRDENRARYPADWPEISQRIRAEAGNRCEWCGVENSRTIWRGTHDDRPAYRYIEDTVFMPSHCAENGEEIAGSSWDDFDMKGQARVVLTVAHMDHQPENCERDNLRALCQRCHNIYDLPMRRAGIEARARAARADGDLFGEAD